jgi:molecular chaperone GrpE
MADQREPDPAESSAATAALERPAEQKRDEYLALLHRTRADFENYQKRVQRELAEARRYCHAEFARELVPALDNLRRAVDAARLADRTDPLAEGVALVHSELLGAFGRFGITPIDALGQPFDPATHEAVMRRPEADVRPGTIVEVLEPGYRLHDRVLRPARVAVAVPAEPAGPCQPPRPEGVSEP